MKEFVYEIEATGTLWKVSWWSASLTQEDSQNLWESLVLSMQEFESLYSRFLPESFLNTFHKEYPINQSVRVPSDFVRMLSLYRSLSHLCDGKITPFGGKIISDLGYDREYSFQKKEGDVFSVMFDDVLCIDSDSNITLKKKVDFDLGALGKGYLLQSVLEKIKGDERVSRVIINAGGDIGHFSHSGERARIALENPHNPSQALGVYELGNATLASSATRKRMWQVEDGKEMHHIYDPQKGASTESVSASWVVHPDGAVADGLATSLFLVDPQKLLQEYDFEYAVLAETDSLSSSKSFKNVFFTQ